VFCNNKEPLNKPFVIISALYYSMTFHQIDIVKFNYAVMGFTDKQTFLKKMSLLPVVGTAGETFVSQLWMHQDLTEFEMDADTIHLNNLTVDVDYPIIHILERS